MFLFPTAVASRIGVESLVFSLKEEMPVRSKRILSSLMAGCLMLPGYVSVGRGYAGAATPSRRRHPRSPDQYSYPSLADAPFAGTVNTQSVRQLADGTTITLKNHRAIARDNAGRIFQAVDCSSRTTDGTNRLLPRLRSATRWRTSSTSAFPGSASASWSSFPRPDLRLRHQPARLQISRKI